MIPFERVALFEGPNLVELSSPLHFRNGRSAQFDSNEDDLTSLTGASQAGLLASAAAPLPSTRRRDPNQSFLDSLRGVGIASAEDQLAGASSLQGSPQGPDYVDYGAYTGKKGAFGWYSDHPVLLGYHRR
ncbi:hypothetical protein TCAL_00044 [Tigriopus californicus]|uniref:Uncharacterized protein n=1 Tax=Tigriopus californicus TaxID=6832 RepID=A0A553PHE7_TIGCA|nr:uncharacterized protein LOC131880524 [Tigriopus californicus]TRY77112.1 hypothetical protein TCAL_00044 [Tigriopus californicus]|eukprot:TCALIF_00044-PA protein Name:"Protein of unknown function" AED:0.22 eAED:0.22 QI:145/1/1/1/1/1/2/194/129